MELTLTDILMAVLTILAIIITKFIVPLLKTSHAAAEYEQLETLVVAAVEAAEQIFRESGMGKEKKAYVLKYLNDKGFVVDEQMLDNMIEACVLELKRGN